MYAHTHTHINKGVRVLEGMAEEVTGLFQPPKDLANYTVCVQKIL